MAEEEWIEKLKEEGFSDIQVMRFPANTDFGEHAHDKQTVHVMLEGEMTLTEGAKIETRRADEHFEIPAGTTHSVICGPAGCAFIVGVR